jgi:hypothetical protein
MNALHFTPAARSPWRAWLILIAMILLTLAAYWPALHGGYLFDDDTYFVSNPDIHVTSLRPGEWLKAARSQSNFNLLMRPLSSLTFAANYYFTGLDPFWPKLTNVAIHLCNGLLLFLVLRQLFRLRADVQHSTRTHDLAAAVIAGAWLLLPINLTCVAYVSQRMEALATSFVFAGLYWYLRARRRQFADGRGSAQLWLSLVACTAAGLTAKEDAALLPLYSACLEFAITAFRDRDGSWSRPVLRTHVVVLLLPLIAGLVLVGPSWFHNVTGGRNFSTAGRLLTESRVLVDYISWSLFPNLNSLTFFHDDVALSHGLLDPPATLLAIGFLLALLGIALWQRARRPLFCLGILWFFAGHSMTATVIPLELVFEHRNYFPSVGLLLACASLVALEPGLHSRAVQATLAGAFIAFFAFTTFLRAEEWSNPVRLAYAEALKRPGSERAQYELARTLLVAADNGGDSTLIDKSLQLLQRAAANPDSGITCLQALIFVSGHAHRPIDPGWWRAIVQKLHDRAPSVTDIDAIISLFRCQLDGGCPVQKQELADTFAAALARSAGNVNLISAYSDFALQELGDAELAERMGREAVSASPHTPVFRENLIRLLIATGQFDKAETEIAQLQSLNVLGALDSEVAELQRALREAKASRGEAPPTAQGLPTEPTGR